ncbi:hypothetical protein [Jiella avicenniae]|uniref:Uncharacterized protein n=1 Tax=Jiella avicenniae TaxID=2907202 RepID=A0A9X1NZ50_9HYPH|nr:hypothetical protein [Jiella avicenniae]MCE7026939.1 hypothetical protein [Jiella avicenniae]
MFREDAGLAYRRIAPALRSIALYRSIPTDALAEKSAALPPRLDVFGLFVGVGPIALLKERASLE